MEAGPFEGAISKTRSSEDFWVSSGNRAKPSIAKGDSREAALDQVRDAFYKGELADAIVAFHKDNNGLIRHEDLSNYQSNWENPPRGQFGPYEILTHDSWSQGMTLSMALDILSGVDLKAMGHNSGKYIHTVSQAIELAMSDREAYFGDPNFVNVPKDALLNPSYGQSRRQAFTEQAFGSFPAPIAIPGYDAYIANYKENGGT